MYLFISKVHTHDEQGIENDQQNASEQQTAFTRIAHIDDLK